MTVKTVIGSITASKDVLNELSMALLEASESYTEREAPAIGYRLNEASSQIYSALCGKDYYRH